MNKGWKVGIDQQGAQTTKKESSSEQGLYPIAFTKEECSYQISAPNHSLENLKSLFNINNAMVNR